MGEWGVGGTRDREYSWEPIEGDRARDEVCLMGVPQAGVMEC